MMLFRNTFLVLVFSVHFVISNIKYTTSKQLISVDTIQPQGSANEISVYNPTPYKEKICTDIDVRNYVSNFEVIRGCTVVEGYVQINLIDNSTAQDFANLSFPELKEITEYLSFYHVSGLKSIGSLFPNLAIIRGNTFSVTDYSFSVFSMFNLQDIGLQKLTHIMKGAVMILRNPGLCFVHTVNWTAIASKSYVHINDIKSQEACEQIYESKKTRTKHCEFYWSNDNCQLTKEVEHCDKLCAGGCNGPTANDCFACTGFLHDGQCLEKCPPGLLSYMNRRCLTEEECLKNKRAVMKNFPDGLKMSYAHNAKWRPFNNSCIDECPPGFNTTADETSCVKCPDCPKVCGGIAVKSIEQCHSVKGCTVINGSLEIQIQTGDSEVVHEELERGLGMITNITGHLKISHSLPIQSLNFLRSLQSIHGDVASGTPEPLLYSNYSLIVWDNPNLQELWNWSYAQPNSRGHPNFEIRKGKILFHDNPKLCMDKIHELMRITNITPDSNFDIPKESNGVEFICGSSNLTLQILHKTDVSLRFKLLESQSRPNFNQRYVLFYVKEDNGTYTKYDTVGNCEASGWKFKDMDNRDKISEITQLEPATKYAVFVKIYNDERIVRSNIIFQSTLPTLPSVPYQLEVTHVNSSSVTLSWGPPKHRHGVLEKYIVKAYYQDYDVNYLDTRNYCDNKLRDLSESSHSSSLLRLIKSKPKECCGKLLCDFDHESLQYLTTQMQLIQQCDNYLLKYVHYNYLNNSMDDTSSQNNSSRLPDKEEVVMYPETSLTMVHLGHFRSIMFSVSACRRKEEDKFLPHDSEKQRCSEEAMVIGRTELDHKADTIPPDTFDIKYINHTALLIRWSPPRHPNGIVVAYNIEYKREHGNSEHMCRTRKEIEKEAGLYILDWSAGSYEFRIRAVSLGGEGPWTEWKHCTIHGSDTDKSLYYTIVSIFLLILFSMLAMIIFLIYRQKKKMKMRENGGNLWVSVNPEYVKVPYVADEWEVERDDVELRGILGKGTFGIVHEGFIKSKNLKCAVKTIMDTANDRDRIDFLNEASTMKTFSSAHNIVCLIGVVSKGHPPLILIEYMALHDLKTFLRNTRDSEKTPPPPSLILIKMAAQIADGMEYMEARKFVHCDLAARNCMVAEDLSVKIGDLGMSRDVFQQDYYRKGGKGLMPVRWMAPESIRDGVFTSFSDVWSYGIVLWEMAMLAEQPYQGLSNEEVIKFVKSGRTLSSLCMPQICPDILRNIMLQAWAWRPSSRPTFHQIVALCEEYVDDKFRSTSFHHSEECIRLKEANAASSSSRRLLELTEPVVSYHKSNDSSSSGSADAVITKES